MKTLTSFTDELATALQKGEVAVIRTDTLYGIVASAKTESAVERVYELRRRNPSKASIILIGSVAQILPGTSRDAAHQKLLRKYWPGPVSLLFPVDPSFPKYLSRGQKNIAYRMPGDVRLREFLRQSGPLIAPSANLEGMPPAKSVAEAYDYFGDKVAFYVDGGVCEESEPSRLIGITSDMKEIRYR